eukprot:974843-Pelagomonas_calceolata.AAC.1
MGCKYISQFYRSSSPGVEPFFFRARRRKANRPIGFLLWLPSKVVAAVQPLSSACFFHEIYAVINSKELKCYEVKIAAHLGRHSCCACEMCKTSWKNQLTSCQMAIGSNKVSAVAGEQQQHTNCNLVQLATLRLGTPANGRFHLL